MAAKDVDRLLGYVPDIANALLLTIGTAFIAIALASLIGIVTAGVLLGSNRPLRRIADVYVEIVRAIPELVQIYVWFYFLPSTGIVLPPIVAGIIALSVAFGPYMAEVFRAGLLAIDRTQWEAAQVLGMNRLTRWRRVILPQAFRTVLPVWTGYFITMYKATSLLSFITVPELFGYARFEAATNFRYFELFGIVMVLYLAIGVPTVAVLHWVERRLDVGRAPREIALNERAVGTML
jgi:polar amino acid transport system permease protein